MPAASALTALALGATLAVSPAPTPEPVLRLQDPALVESSGLAVSALHDGLLWTHADGGRSAQVRGVDRTGATVAVATLIGIDPWDPEALATSRSPDGRPQLWLGDIGDNFEARDDVSVFRFDEPAALGERSVPATWFRFRYPDGPHDAEALLVHPQTGEVFIATKDLGGGGLYRSPRDLVPEHVGVNPLTRVAGVPFLVTDGAFLPDGRFVLRTYGSVFLYDRPGHQVASAPLPAQPQGESIAVDGDRLLVGSEGERSAVYAVPIPETDDEEPPAAETPRPTQSGGGAQATSGQESPSRVPAGIAGLAAASALLGVVLAARRRGRGR